MKFNPLHTTTLSLSSATLVSALALAAASLGGGCGDGDASTTGTEAGGTNAGGADGGGGTGSGAAGATGGAGGMANSCGDGTVDAGEACDDGNTDAGDGCDAGCEAEVGWSCAAGSPTVCTPKCGDGLVVGDEQCDDGNGDSYDGCDSCFTDVGFHCEIVNGVSTCSPTCGDGLVVDYDDAPACAICIANGCVDEVEACLADADCMSFIACGNTCGDDVDCIQDCAAAAPGSLTDAVMSCADTTCAGACFGEPEGCDDGNSNSGDGCDDTCAIEVGHCCDSALTDCSMSLADSYELTGLNVAVPANAYDGTVASMTCQAITLTAPARCNPGTIADMDVGLNLGTTQAGDMVFKVISPDNQILTLMSRPGYAEPADDGTGTTVGAVADMSAQARLTFDDEAVVSAELMGNGLSTTDLVCVFDGICNFYPFPDTAAGTALSDFDGQPATGTWQICVADSAGANGATLGAVAISVTRN